MYETLYRKMTGRELPPRMDSKIHDAIRKLPERHCNTLKWRYEEGLTYDEIGKRLSISRQRANQVEDDAILELTSRLYFNGDELVNLGLKHSTYVCFEKAGITKISEVEELVKNNALSTVKALGQKKISNVMICLAEYRERRK